MKLRRPTLNLLALTLLSSAAGGLMACGSSSDKSPATITDLDDDDGGGDGDGGDGDGGDGDGGDGDGGDGDGGDGDGGDGDGGDGDGGDGDDTAEKPSLSIVLEGNIQNIDSPATDRIIAQCRAQAGNDSESSKLDTSTVSLSLSEAEGTEVAKEPAALVDGESDLFFVEFPLSNLTSGAYVLTCSASTVGTEPAEHSINESIFVDGGPKISVISPKADSAFSSATPVRFDFLVESSPLDKDDDDAEVDVDSVQLSIEGISFPAQRVPDSTDEYFALVNFADNSLFPELPSGEVLVAASASNSRGKNAVSSELIVSYQVDGTGPVITLKSPADGDIIGGKVKLTFTATDAISGVNPASVEITLNDTEYAYNDSDNRWLLQDSTYSFEFDSNSVTGSIVQTNVQINATDRAGNQAEAKSALYQRDEQPPILSLTPPLFREGNPDGATDFCSHAFYPTGNATRGGVVDDLVFFRAAIWDRTNTTTGQQTITYAGIDQSTAELWVQRAGTPLLIDSTQDGQCDDIITTDAKLQELTALKPIGAAFYGDGTDDSALPPMSIPASGDNLVCSYKGDASPPKNLCEDDSDLTVIAHRSNKKEPIIYAINPTTSGPRCTGSTWELPSAGLTDYQGWVCAAARAHDNVGNRGVSRPLALCLDNSQVAGVPDCATDLSNIPNCTDGCSLPDAFNADGVVYRK